MFYLANKQDNIFFTILGDCKPGGKEVTEKDEEIKSTGISEIENLNKKYPNDGFPRFNFAYRKRVWNEKEKCYLGWERKRGLLTELNEYLMRISKGEEINTTFQSNPINKNNLHTKEQKSTLVVNTIEDYKRKHNIENIDIKYVITLDADTNLSLDSGIELIEAMAHPLNKPVIDEEKNVVVDRIWHNTAKGWY